MEISKHGFNIRLIILMQNQNKKILAIDASRNRSGGAKSHLIGILSEFDFDNSGFDEVHLWSYSELLDLIPEKKWLKKHCPNELSRPIYIQIFWQRYIFPKELKKYNCSILLNTDAGTVSNFKPCVTMSRDMLSFEPGEMGRYGFTPERIRLEILKFIQARSLRNASGAIFLTKYASKIIQKFSGKIDNYALIPHGVGENFRSPKEIIKWPDNNNDPIKCIYVSPAWRFKHQWHVVKAVENLRRSGINIKLKLVGGGDGKALENLNKQIAISDPDNSFITRLDFVDHKLLPNLLAESHLSIFASSCENMPNSLIESMATGLPIACSNRGPMPEILIDGGVYFDPEDYLSISSAIKELIKDPNLREEKAHKAKQYSKIYTWNRCSRETCEFLNLTLSELRNDYY
jgi:glycosyltransferase involved in cell wall biosynthesis